MRGVLFYNHDDWKPGEHFLDTWPVQRLEAVNRDHRARFSFLVLDPVRNVHDRFRHRTVSEKTDVRASLDKPDLPQSERVRRGRGQIGLSGFSQAQIDWAGHVDALAGDQRGLRRI